MYSKGQLESHAADQLLSKFVDGLGLGQHAGDFVRPDLKQHGLQSTLPVDIGSHLQSVWPILQVQQEASSTIGSFICNRGLTGPVLRHCITKPSPLSYPAMITSTRPPGPACRQPVQTWSLCEGPCGTHGHLAKPTDVRIGVDWL